MGVSCFRLLSSALDKGSPAVADKARPTIWSDRPPSAKALPPGCAKVLQTDPRVQAKFRRAA